MNDAPTNPTAPSRWRTGVAPLLILLVAVCYYGSYLPFWFNPHDEGGTAAFIAQRLLEGEVPLRDVRLGYNLGWFWPVVALFKIGGVNFLLMRAYFFALATLSALCGWAVVRRVTRHEWLALATGLALVVFPGSQFKNYIPLLCVANMLAVLNAALSSGAGAAAFWRRVLAGGLVLGLTFLIRIDLGYLFSLLWAGLVFLRLFDVRTGRGRLADALTTAAILGAMCVVTHAPVYLIARAGGYAPEFVRQYAGWADYLSGQAGALVGVETVKPAGANAGGGQGRARAADRRTLPRMTWAKTKTVDPDDQMAARAQFLLTYAPLGFYAGLLGWACWGVLGAIFQKRFALDQPASLALLALVASLAAFPQFFVFRPDRPHLSEFMPGYTVAVVCAVWLLRGRWRWLAGGVFLAQFSLFGWFALDHYSAGTIAARIKIKKSKRVFFDGDNGVRVWVHQKEHRELDGVRRTVVTHSQPGDWLVCYPYQPGYNLMCDRRTYERDLYQDNATAPRGWPRQAIARIEQYQPAVIIIDNRPINQRESSRFSAWARPAYEHIRARYGLAAKLDTIEIYARDMPPAATQ